MYEIYLVYKVFVVKNMFYIYIVIILCDTNKKGVKKAVNLKHTYDNKKIGYTFERWFFGHDTLNAREAVIEQIIYSKLCDKQEVSVLGKMFSSLGTGPNFASRLLDKCNPEDEMTNIYIHVIFRLI